MTAGVPPLRDIVPGWRPSAPGRTIAAVEGEGIGAEVVGAALTVLSAACDAWQTDILVDRSGPIGSVGPAGFGLDQAAVDFYDSAFERGRPVLTGPAGGRFVYELRARYELFVKLVPTRPDAGLADASVIRPERLREVDVLIVRDNIGGLYQGAFSASADGRSAFQEARYDLDTVEALMQVAVAAARARGGRLAVVTKPGGIPTISALWRRVAEEHAGDDVVIDVIEVDNACFQLVADPHRFDVVAAPNMLGDVVADTAALVLGSRGLSYSANFGLPGRAVYQTGHGAAHDLAGLDRANPIAQIRSLAWLIRESLELPHMAESIETAVDSVLADGFRTADIAGPGSTVLGTQALATRIADRVRQAALDRAAP